MPRDREDEDERRPPRRRADDYDDAPRRPRRRSDGDDDVEERRPRRRDEYAERFADEAEDGYDTDRLRARPGRSRRDEQDADEAPRRRSRRDEDEQDTDEPPRRARRSERDEQDEERPSPRRSRRQDAEREPDEQPRRRGARESAQANSGWGAAKAVMEESSAFAKALKPTEKPIVIKFLEDDPFDAFASHWLERNGKKKFRCRTKGQCPLCDPFGDQPTSSTLHFNVVSFADPDVPVFEFLEAGARLGHLLEDQADDQRFNGLSDPRLYVAISMTKGGDSKKGAVPKLEVIKERDLYEDWDIEPLTDKQVREFQRQCYDRPVEPIPSVDEMRAIIKELTH
jgi:hypothetical protein